MGTVAAGQRTEESLKIRLRLETSQLRLQNATKRFGQVVAVDHINLEVPGGSFTTLLGPSGCGKTTLLRMIAGFYEPDEGTILLDDHRIDNMPAHRRGTAMVFQDYALFPHMTVYDNVAYGLRLAKTPPAELAKRVLETLIFVGLSGLDKRWPGQLSGGQQQRVALARALVVRPKVLLLDEPLSNLDANLRERMRWELRTLQQELGITFVYVTHDQSEALAMSDWIAVLKDGRLIQWGKPWDIYYHPRTAFMAEFVGSANLRPARVVAQSNGRLVVDMQGFTMDIPAPSEPVGDNVLLCLRPEAIYVAEPSTDSSAIQLPAIIKRSAFLGDIMRYWLDAAGGEWVVDQPDPGALARLYEGNVVLRIHPERVHVISGE